MPGKRQVDFAVAGPVKNSQPPPKRVKVDAESSSKGKGKSEKNATDDTFYAVAGSYERILYGVQATVSKDDISIKPVFSFPAHQSCIKAAATGVGATARKLWLATSSTDDTLKLWDLIRRKELGTINAHDSSVTSMSFVPDHKDPTSMKYLLTTSEDATLNLFRTKDWALVRTFKGHKGRVNHVAVHPDHRIAISVGNDRTMRMWDLLGSQGQAAGGGKQGSNSTALGTQAELVRWNAKGDKFAVLCDRELRIYGVNMRQLKTLTSKSRFHDVCFSTTANSDSCDLIFVGCEDGKTRIYRLSQDSTATTSKPAEAQLDLVAELIGHSKRVKSIQLITINTRSLAVTISSDGFLHVYDIAKLDAADKEGPTILEPTAKYSTKGSRLTCLSVLLVPAEALQAAAGRQSGKIEEDSTSVSAEDSDDDQSDSSDDSLEDEDLDVEGLSGLSDEISEHSALEAENGGEEVAESGASDEEAWTGIADD